MRIFKANFVRVYENNVLYLYNKIPKPGNGIVIKNPSILIDEDNNLNLTGDEMIQEYSEKFFITDATPSDEVPSGVEYRTFSDWWKGKLTPYIEGRFWTKKTRPYKMITNHWTINDILENGR